MGDQTPRQRHQHHPLVPRPPQAKNMVEFVVQVFAVTVATILMLSMIGAAALVAAGLDAAPVINSITDITNTIIGALIGFVAGKGQGKVEAEEEHRHEQERKDRLP